MLLFLNVHLGSTQPVKIVLKQCFYFLNVHLGNTLPVKIVMKQCFTFKCVSGKHPACEHNTETVFLLLNVYLGHIQPARK